MIASDALLIVSYWAGLFAVAGLLGLFIAAFFAAARQGFVLQRGDEPTSFDYCVMIACGAGLVFVGAELVPVEWVSVSGFAAVIAGIFALILWAAD